VLRGRALSMNLSSVRAFHLFACKRVGLVGRWLTTWWRSCISQLLSSPLNYRNPFVAPRAGVLFKCL